MTTMRFVVPLLLVSLIAPALLAQEAKPPATEAPPAFSADPATLAMIVEKLSPESRKAFGEMLALDWRDRPEWADMLIAMLRQQPINLGVGWFQPGTPKYDWKWTAEKLDANKDGLISKEEIPKDAPYGEVLYARLDRDGDGEVRAADFDFFS